jgi:L-2-hydroxycarboxylate dehydrogenase (NAD+)
LPSIPITEVREVVAGVLARAGVPVGHAVTQSNALIEAELRGVSSHGLLRLPLIVERIANGVTDPTATGVHSWRAPGFLAVDGQRGLGPVVAAHALDASQARAAAQGICIAAIRNSNHIGMLSNYSESVAARGQSIIALSTSEALVHPWGGYTPLIGTNPISIGVPTEGEPFVMDAATSIVSMGRIHDKAIRGESIPRGWAVAADGKPTTDPSRAKQGAISPFGEAKGYALGLAFELLVAALAGSALGTNVRGTLDATQICNKGDLFIIIDGPSTALSAYLDTVRSTPPAQGFEKVLIPGERGQACKRERLARGVPVAEPLWLQLLRLAGRL